MPYTETKTIEIPELTRIAVALERLADHFCNPPKPGSPTVQVISQIQIKETTMLKFNVTLPAFDDANPNDNDVVTRRLTVSVQGGPVITVDSAADVTTVENDGFVGNNGETVTLSLVDIDAAGNQSAPSEAGVTLADVIPPPAPGAIGLAVTGQV